MAKKKKEEIHYGQLSVEELAQKVDKNSQDLFKLRFRSATAPLKNTMQIRQLRREIARLKTFMNQSLPAKSLTVSATSVKQAGSPRRAGRKSV